MKYLILIICFINTFVYAEVSHKHRKHKHSIKRYHREKNSQSTHQRVNSTQEENLCFPNMNRCSEFGKRNADGQIPDYIFKALSNLELNAARNGLDSRGISQLIQFYLDNYDSICNKKYLTFVDYNKNQSQNRFTIINLEDNSFDSTIVANGGNTDKNHDGKADRFSNIFSEDKPQNTSSIGFFLTGKKYTNNKGHSLKLNGLSGEKYNSNACKRGLIIHGDGYPGSNYKVATGGRSSGCLTLSQKKVDETIEKLENGSLIYSYHNELASVYPTHEHSAVATSQAAQVDQN